MLTKDSKILVKFIKQYDMSRIILDTELQNLILFMSKKHREFIKKKINLIEIVYF